MSTFVGDLGENCLASVQRDYNLKVKGENYDWRDFMMGVAATLPELSEWTLTNSALLTKTDN